MIDTLKAFLDKGDIYTSLIKRVYDNPYEEKKKAFAALEYDDELLEKALSELEDEMILLSLTTQSASGFEARVMKTILLINPELENDMGGLL